VVSNLAEIEEENPQNLRILAFVYEFWGRVENSIEIYERILKIRGEGSRKILPHKFRILQNLNHTEIWL
jgi:hypothetical protein